MRSRVTIYYVILLLIKFIMIKPDLETGVRKKRTPVRDQLLADHIRVLPSIKSSLRSAYGRLGDVTRCEVASRNPQFGNKIIYSVLQNRHPDSNPGTQAAVSWVEPKYGLEVRGGVPIIPFPQPWKLVFYTNTPRPVICGRTSMETQNDALWAKETKHDRKPLA